MKWAVPFLTASMLTLGQISLAAAGNIQMPGGVDFLRLSALEREAKAQDETQAIRMAAAQKTAVYIDLLGIDKDTDAQLMFTRQKKLSGDSADKVRDRFANSITSTERFRVFNARNSQSGVEGETSIYVHGRILSVHQDILDRLGVRKAVTTVTISLAISDSKDGKVLRSKTITGIYGDDPGEGEPIPRGVSLQNAEVQNNLQNSYEKALVWALEIAAAYIEKTYRPMGIVLAESGDNITMYGGEAHGIHDKDRLLVFRLKPIPGMSRRDMSEKIPIAIMECIPDTTSSTCQVTERRENATIQKGDLAVLTDTSLRLHPEGQ